jgi:threonine/homoserine/homoserine lactone efflux protein
MDLLSFIAEVEAITVSGALSPGPLTVSAAGLGIRSGKRAGLLVSLGHMAFEFPLVLLISTGLSIAQSFKQLLSIIGGAFLLYFALTQIRSLGKVRIDASERNGNAFVAGILLTALNPYFIIWWLTVGAKLVMDSMQFPLGVMLMYALHVWMDFAWLTFIAYAFYRGSRLNESLLKAIMGILSLILIFFGLEFIYNAFR